MSLIAKSLKRLQTDRKTHKKAFTGTVNPSQINEVAIYALLLLVCLGSFGLYFISTNKKIEGQIKEKDLSIISKIEKNISNGELMIRQRKIKGKGRFEYYLETNKLKELKDLAQKENNIKYLGIYYAKTGNAKKAIELLGFYLKRHQDDQARLYLIMALKQQNRYKEALEELKKINTQRYEVYLDRAVIYEEIGMIDKARQNYREALKMTPDPVLRGTIKSKLVVLGFVK
ncbi:tetratricopeptide repeat protein [Hippea sp. KM1]|uniref:tetratricopeptide repeat protein n=1 Tax=Hippea sp. KM1 TaxID=944481 RepID=UPI00046C9101|nr:tetratricopeptide repeat protein [Hippea sp. KM1]